VPGGGINWFCEKLKDTPEGPLELKAMAEEKPLREKMVSVADPDPPGSTLTTGGEIEIAKSCGAIVGVTCRLNA